jgi:hypothetical protein
MAAVMALIFVPALATVALMLASNLGGSLGPTFATLLYAALAMGVFAGLFKMARRWEDEVP